MHFEATHQNEKYGALLSVETRIEKYLHRAVIIFHTLGNNRKRAHGACESMQSRSSYHADSQTLWGHHNAVARSVRLRKKADFACNSQCMRFAAAFRRTQLALLSGCSKSGPCLQVHAIRCHACKRKVYIYAPSSCSPREGC